MRAWGMKHETRPLDPCNFLRAHMNAMINDETMDRNKTAMYKGFVVAIGKICRKCDKKRFLTNQIAPV